MKGNKDMTLRLADVCVRVRGAGEQVRRLCSRFEAAGEKPDIKIRIARRDVELERKISTIPVTEDWQYESLALHRKFSRAAADFGVLMFHASVVAVDGRAFAFTAPSGTGKSTHALLWYKLLGRRAVMVNDDKPFVRVSPDGSVTVYGSPWTGKHRRGSNVAFPLAAICFVRRSETNAVSPLDPAAAFPLLVRQIFVPADGKKGKRAMDSLSALLRLPLFTLDCNMDISAAQTAFDTLKGVTAWNANTINH